MRNGLKWRLRKSTNGRCRVLHLIDNQVVCSIIAKGRSSSLRLKRGLKKLNSLVLASGAGGMPIRPPAGPLRQPPAAYAPQTAPATWHQVPGVAKAGLPHGFSTNIYGAGIDTSYGIRSGGAQLSLLQWTQISTTYSRVRGCPMSNFQPPSCPYRWGRLLSLQPPRQRRRRSPTQTTPTTSVAIGTNRDGGCCLTTGTSKWLFGFHADIRPHVAF